MNQIQPLFDQFNQSIRLLNDTLAFSREFQSDADIQRLRNNLKKASQDAIPEITRRNALIDEVRTTRENQQKVGVFIENTGKKTLREVSVTRIVQGIKDGLAFPFKKTGNDLLRRLSSIGIQTREDDTFRVNEAEFKRALTVNTEEVLNIFTNADSGILPRLENQLNRILDQNLGDLALKQVRVEKRSAVPSQLAEKFKKFVENQTIQQQFQNLIAVA